MKEQELQEWLKLPEATKRNIFNEVGNKKVLPPAVIEKDWWVVRTLQLVFTTEIAAHTVFKGGTSLSKAWNIIDRFSEDIDMALDRKFLGFDKEMTNSQVKKLRQHSFSYLSEKYLPLLNEMFKKVGFTDVQLELSEVRSNDEDPIKIKVKYVPLTEPSLYILPQVLIEIGSRSLIEPFSSRTFQSFVGESFEGRAFADTAIAIPTVNPERTFLEKVFLLHEEFQLPIEKIRVDRLSRHLYDLEKLMDTDYAATALGDKRFYQHIVEHRRTITPIRGIDYANHEPSMISILPPVEMIESWSKDYEEMRLSMISKDALPFDELIKRIGELKKRINQLNFS
jgi:hypothetical protein